MKTKKILLTLLKILVSTAFWLGIWVIVSREVDAELLFPSPSSVWRSLSALVVTKDFWLIMLTSLLRVVWGILISWILGTALAAITFLSRFENLILSPAIAVIKATPVASFVILALLWMDTDTLPVFITALIGIPIIWANVSEGLRSVDPNLLELSKVYRFSFSKKIFRLYVPSVAPYFMAACKSSLGLAWKAGIAAEVLAVPRVSIGNQIYYSKVNFESDDLFAWTVVIVILSVIIEKLFVFLLNCLGKRLRILPKGESHAQR